MSIDLRRQLVDATGARQLTTAVKELKFSDPATGLHRSGVDLLRAKELQDKRKDQRWLKTAPDA